MTEETIQEVRELINGLIASTYRIIEDSTYKRDGNPYTFCRECDITGPEKREGRQHRPNCSIDGYESELERLKKLREKIK